MANTSVVITAENDYRWGIDSFIRASANDTINGDQSGAFHCEGGLKFRVMYVVKDHIKKERGMCGTGDMMYECDRDTKVGYLVTANIYVTKPGQGEAKVDTLVVDIGYAREDRESAGYDRAHPRPTWRDAGTKVGKDIASAIARVVKNL